MFRGIEEKRIYQIFRINIRSVSSFDGIVEHLL